jgi:hypothetical protein
MSEEGFRYSDGTAPEDRPEEAERRSEKRAEPKEPEDFTHYVHLADGSVRKHKMTDPLGTHFPVGENEDVHGGHFIIGTYPR